MTAVLTTDRLNLRKVKPRDYPAFEPFALDDRSRFVRNEATVGRAWRTFASFLGHWEIRGYGLFALTLKGDDTAIGIVGPYKPADWPEEEIGWSIWDPVHEGRGLITEAAIAVRAHVYRDLGWTTAVSYIDAENARSIAVAKRLGCTLDETAERPAPEDLVFRHPGPEALS